VSIIIIATISQKSNVPASSPPASLPLVSRFARPRLWRGAGLARAERNVSAISNAPHLKRPKMRSGLGQGFSHFIRPFLALSHSDCARKEGRLFLFRSRGDGSIRVDTPRPPFPDSRPRSRTAVVGTRRRMTLFRIRFRPDRESGGFAAHSPFDDSGGRPALPSIRSPSCPPGSGPRKECRVPQVPMSHVVSIMRPPSRTRGRASLLARAIGSRFA